MPLSFLVICYFSFPDFKLFILKYQGLLILLISKHFFFHNISTKDIALPGTTNKMFQQEKVPVARPDS